MELYGCGEVSGGVSIRRITVSVAKQVEMCGR